VLEELTKFLASGPKPDELARVQTSMRADFIRGIERVGGFGGKSDVLASGLVYCGDPAYYKTYLTRLAGATPTRLQSLAEAWLSDGDYVLSVRPFPKYETQPSKVDRSKLPETSDFPSVSFADVEKAQLSNGLKVLLAQRGAIPVVNFRLLVDAGYAADQFAAAGTADLALNMMDEGTTSRTSQQISEEAAGLGAEIQTGSNLDMSSVTMSALKENLDPSLDLFADVILHPNFPQADFDRLKKEQLATIEREKATPIQMALRVLPQLLYGKDHAYGLPFTGSGYASTVQTISRDDLAKFHDTWFKPNNATLVVVGDTSMAELKPKLEKVFGRWRAGEVPTKNISTVGEKAQSVIYLLDRPGSQQSVILASELAPPKANPHEVAIEAMNQVLGGAFSSRMNMNLREDKHWSYGARTLIVDAEGQRPFVVYAPVQTDKTSESIAEIDKELTDIRSDRPPTPDEVAKAKDQRTLTLPGRWETNNAVLNSIVEMVRFGLPDDYWDAYPGRVRELSDAQVEQAAESVVKPKRLVWVVVGDREKIESGIQKLNLGQIQILDADGNPIESD
jgi:zinc protease